MTDLTTNVLPDSTSELKFQEGPAYWRLLNDYLTHNGYKWKLGLNVDHIPLDEKVECGPGGLYFCEEKDLREHFGRHLYISKIKIPIGEKVIKYTSKAKANKVFLYDVYPIVRHPMFDNSYNWYTYLCHIKDIVNGTNSDKMFYNILSEINGFDFLSDRLDTILSKIHENYKNNRNYQLGRIMYQYNVGPVNLIEPISGFTDDEYCSLIKNFPALFGFITDASDAVVDYAINLGSDTFRYLPKERQTEDLCLRAVKRSSYFMEYIKIQTEEMALLALKKNCPLYMIDPSVRTTTVLYKYLEKFPRLLGELDEKEQTPELVEYCVSKGAQINRANIKIHNTKYEEQLVQLDKEIEHYESVKALIDAEFVKFVSQIPLMGLIMEENGCTVATDESTKEHADSTVNTRIGGPYTTSARVLVRMNAIQHRHTIFGSFIRWIVEIASKTNRMPTTEELLKFLSESDIDIICSEYKETSIFLEIRKLGGIIEINPHCSYGGDSTSCDDAIESHTDQKMPTIASILPLNQYNVWIPWSLLGDGKFLRFDIVVDCNPKYNDYSVNHCKFVDKLHCHYFNDIRDMLIRPIMCRLTDASKKLWRIKKLFKAGYKLSDDKESKGLFKLLFENIQWRNPSNLYKIRDVDLSRPTVENDSADTIIRVGNSKFLPITRELFESDVEISNIMKWCCL